MLKSLKPLNPCYDISAQLYFLLIIMECILNYWLRGDFIVNPEGHIGILLLVVWQI